MELVIFGAIVAPFVGIAALRGQSSNKLYAHQLMLTANSYEGAELKLRRWKCFKYAVKMWAGVAIACGIFIIPLALLWISSHNPGPR